MGKQPGKKKKTVTKPPASSNSINWEGRARELVRQGILSPLVLDNGGYERVPRRATDTRRAGQIERARRDAVQRSKADHQAALSDKATPQPRKEGEPA